MAPTTRDLLANMSLPGPFPPALQQELESGGQPLLAAEGTTLFRPGDEMGSFLLVSAGSIRVFKSSADGREITLYNVGRGQCCTLNVLCLLADRPSPATAFAEEDLRAVAYSRDQFLAWFARHASLRDLVMGQMADRVHTMMALVEEVAFQRLDSRLASYLLAASAAAGHEPLNLTHEAIAMELGSVREVVSRLLKNFEGEGLVALGRGRIEILDPVRLREI